MEDVPDNLAIFNFFDILKKLMIFFSSIIISRLPRGSKSSNVLIGYTIVFILSPLAMRIYEVAHEFFSN